MQINKSQTIFVFIFLFMIFSCTAPKQEEQAGNIKSFLADQTTGVKTGGI